MYTIDMQQIDPQIVSALKRLTFVLGHYGSGKTEVAVNLAFQLAKTHAVTVVDLDIVNPYFRSSERKEALEEAGVRVISAAMGGRADVPALPPEIAQLWGSKEGIHLFDVGGDPVGSRVLARYSPNIKTEDTAVFMVLNARRPETQTLERALKTLEGIEHSSKQKVTHLINNTHLCEATTLAEVKEGEVLALKLAERCGIDLLCSTVPRALMGEAKLLRPALALDIYMKKPWVL